MYSGASSWSHFFVSKQSYSLSDPVNYIKKTSENNTNLSIVMFIITVEVKLQKRS